MWKPHNAITDLNTNKNARPKARIDACVRRPGSSPERLPLDL